MEHAANVAEFFDSYASDFNAIYGNRNTFVNRVVNRYLRSSMRIRFEKTIEGCQPVEGRSVVDIGTGPGHYAIMLAKQGAGRVLGLDFAEGMIEVAKRNAEQLDVADNCEFAFGDFLTFESDEKFDYAIAMGFMDYIADPRPVIDRVLSMTSGKAFFSFPVEGGLLGWQRKLRYKKRCDLYLFTEQRLRDLFDGAAAQRVDIEQISRDYFVTATVGAASSMPEPATAASA